MPHHGVFKPDSTSTKLRVVFNASSPTTTGKSLNDVLLSGEIDEDVFNIMLRFRKHQIVLIADIRQMFRQILIEPSQRDLLRILWKTKEEEEPVSYRLKTVTYGTKCAPFLATRVLRQLAMDEVKNFPLASEGVLSDVYMDDIVTGSQDLGTAIVLKDQLINLFNTCGMVLHKWNSNARELLDLKNENSEISFNQKEDSTIKTLGMAWKSNEDQFIFKVSVKEQTVYTKRDVLSTIAKLFDPLGLLGPVICKAKIFLQRLWLEKVNWDDPLPERFASYWYRFVCNLKEIEKIKFGRYILNSQPERIVLLGFSDASTHAYGAVVYLQCHAKDSTPLSKLLASKSRVAPLKTISVPRLELCACLLLAKLVEKVLLSLKMNIEEVILFSDSTIALAWINSPPHQLKPFVGNRVSKIQSLTEHHQWRHISSTENPADIISRGADPTDLKNHNLWWTGPTIFIEETNNDFSSSEIKMDSFEKELYSAEHKQLYTNNLVLSSDSEFITQILSLSNNFQKLIRIISFNFRFLYNCKTKEKKSGSISVEEF
ncbi:hypothetical protein AVEN_261134-1 [Araneus ventricosus]|uniref:Reverse transcriptase domain-containing protein n=1 Tax=Araneus ventricosus TaxID=182803 RepID=A0A4Y2IZF9_ARAVE|nr:hypothetical protein AVEN_261134-1 [Araneus ventricosus]